MLFMLVALVFLCIYPCLCDGVGRVYGVNWLLEITKQWHVIALLSAGFVEMKFKTMKTN